MKRKLTAEQLEKLTDAIEEVGADALPYSGRAMFGESCLGIIPNTDTARYFLYLAQILIENEEQEILDLLLEEPSKEDSLGKGIIVYFPNLLVDDDEESE